MHLRTRPKSVVSSECDWPPGSNGFVLLAGDVHAGYIWSLWMLTEQSELQGADPRREWLYTWSTKRVLWSVSMMTQHVFLNKKMCEQLSNNTFCSCYILKLKTDSVASQTTPCASKCITCTPDSSKDNAAVASVWAMCAEPWVRWRGRGLWKRVVRRCQVKCDTK